MDAKVRLFVNQPLGQGQAVDAGPEQANYLFSVMRLAPGSLVRLFNGQDGEWIAKVELASKKRGVLICQEQSAPQLSPPDLWLLFAPIRKERTNFVVEKAVELGVARVQPVTTRFTNSERWRLDKQVSHAIEAAEQCGATFVPQIEEVAPLDRLLANWPQDRVLYWADESRVGQPHGFPGDHAAKAPSAILIGPEGGFSDEEKAALSERAFVRPFSLGPRILRAETAAIAALALWQNAMGDWR